MNWPPEVGLELAACFLFGDCFRVSHEAVPGVVDNNIDLTEFLQSAFKCGSYALLGCHVQWDFQHVWFIGQVRERLEAASCGYDAVAGGMDGLCKRFS